LSDQPHIPSTLTQADVREEAKFAKFDILKDGMEMVATGIGFSDQDFNDFLEHREYGLANEVLTEHIAENAITLSGPHAWILDHIAKAMATNNEADADKDFMETLRNAEIVAMNVAQQDMKHNGAGEESLSKLRELRGLMSRIDQYQVT
jgi:hypothetical protein